MKISIIAAVAKGNLGIGYRGNLCYRIPDDLRRFKDITMGNPIIMGTKTFLSLPDQKPLPGRLNVVIGKSLKSEELPDGVDRFDTLPAAIMYLDSYFQKAFIIGGGQLYKASINLADELILTEIEGEPDADVFFPEWREEGKWKLVEKEERTYNGLKYDFTKYNNMSILRS